MRSPFSSASNPSGTIRLFRFAGIDVFLHWTWIFIALIEFRDRNDIYTSQIWNVAEYVTLFCIVLMHEFGHALACRSVGGRADRILLWPLGGIAYVSPPMRPGAWLWSIAAGPLVNVLLLPVTFGLLLLTPPAEVGRNSDLNNYMTAVVTMNIMLLAFNLLPIYPLDGGKIVMSILWRWMHFERALSIAANIGMLGAGAVMGLAIYLRDIWLIAIALFSAWNCWIGIQQAHAIRDARAMHEANYPRRGL